MKKSIKFKSYKTAPRNGNAFIGITAGPSLDIMWYDKESKCFRDYFHKQKITYLMSWVKLPKTDGIYDQFGCGVYNSELEKWIN